MKLRLYYSTALYLSDAINPSVNSPVEGKPGVYVFAQPNEIVAHAYAIKNDQVFVTGHSGWIYTGARGRNEFLGGLPKNKQGQSGGYIYEVAPDHFEEAKPGHPRKEYLSNVTVPILATRFVTLEDIMRKGVQIFVVDDPSYFREENITHPDGYQLFERYKVGEVGWLNQEYRINPIMPPPAAKAAKASVKKLKPK